MSEDNKIKKGSILIKPRISEKAAVSADKVNAFVFNVAREATKKEIASAIKAEYKFTPLKVNIVNKGREKKAYIYLKKGEKIEIA